MFILNKLLHQKSSGSDNCPKERPILKNRLLGRSFALKK